VTSRVALLLTLAALVALTPVVLTTAARSRAESGDSTVSTASGDASLQQAEADADAAAAGAVATPRARSQAADFAPPAPRRTFAVARVRGTTTLHTRPGGPVAAKVPAGTEFGSPQTLSVAHRRGRWLGVVSTALPNGKLGWLSRDDRALSLKRVGYSLHADLSSRTLVLRRGNRRIARISVAVGRPGSATPTGRFSVTDKISGSRFGPYYGCCILALSGHQPNTPAGWRGGDRLAIHGTNAPGSVGQASSAGCLRAADKDLAVLMRRVPLGTPVFIRS
jgi:hypothetical protein